MYKHMCIYIDVHMYIYEGTCAYYKMNTKHGGHMHALTGFDMPGSLSLYIYKYEVANTICLNGQCPIATLIGGVKPDSSSRELVYKIPVCKKSQTRFEFKMACIS